MKELSIEEKAKAYDEALKVLHKYDGANIMFTQDLKEEMFPELIESEDDGIRKQIIEHIKWSKDVGNCAGEESQRWIAWLEKQGESIKIKKGKNYLCTKTHKYAGVEWRKGIKYYSPEDYSLVNQGCTCYCPKYSKEEHNNFFKEVEYDGCLENQAEQKPAEDVDLPEFESHLCLMFQKFRTKGMCTNGEIIDYVKEHSQKLRDILVKPAWSEEDEKIYQSIMDDTVQENQLSGKQTDWLRDIKYRYFSQHQNRWKPSEAQLEALKNAIHIKPFENPSDSLLWKLYEQLKKLREE